MVAYKYVHAKRYKKIIAVFSRYGFGLIFKQMGLTRPLKLIKNDSDIGSTSYKISTSAGARLKLALEELGPTFVKLGQILSIRSDILPPDITDELKLLQDSVAPFPFSEVRMMIENEFEDTLENIYMEFSEEPIAAASISQVHCAKLISGKRVAVKIQRPDIESLISVDLEILASLAHFIDTRTKYGQLYDCSGMVAEFEKTIKNELDFTKEGENADTFRENFIQDKGITVPRIKWIYTTKRVLTMEYIDGISIRANDVLDQWGINKSILAEKLAASICNQILRDGFFHADPHPGNIQVIRDGTIVFLDTGMVGHLSESNKQKISRFFIGVVSKNSKMVVQSIVEMDSIYKRSNLKRFEKDIDIIIEKYLTMAMSEVKIDELLYEIFHTAFVNHMKIPREFAILAKTLGTLQGLLEKLDPNLNSLVIAKPIAKKLMYKSVSPEKIGTEIKTSLVNYGALFKKLPITILDLFDKLEDNDFSVQFELKELDKLQRWSEKIFNRMSFSVVLLAVSIIIAGAIIGSALSPYAGVEMYLLNYTLLKTGLSMAVIILLGLIISISKSKR